jgi:hypothetical protein
LTRVEFFTDRDLGLTFPAILTAAGLQVHRHQDYFGPTTSDEDWLSAVAAKGWVSVTHDGRIRYKPNEIAAVVTHRVRLLVVIGKAPNAQLAANFIATLDRINHFLEDHEPPVIGKVYMASASDRLKSPPAPGRVELWYPRR